MKPEDGRLSMRGWLDAMRAGRGFMTTGPLVELEVDGRIPGETVEIGRGGEVTVRFTVTSIAPLITAELVFNGEVVAEVPFTGDRKSLELERTFRPERSGWYHLRVEGARGEAFPFDVSYAQAVTNPVWVTVDGAPVRSADAADYAIRWIDRLQQMAEEWPHWRSQAEKDHVYAQFEEARAVYRRLGAEAAGT